MAEPAVASVALDEAVLVGPGTVRGTVTLDARAAARTAVALAADDPALTVPSAVAVPAGQRAAGFSVAAAAVRTLTRATVSATAGGATRSAPLTLRPPRPLLEAIWVDRDRVAGGGRATATVALGSPAPAGGVTVDLEASGGVAVPARVEVAAGADVSPSFAVEAPEVLDDTPCELRAMVGASGVWTRIVVEPPPLRLAGLAVERVGANEESISLSWTVTLTAVAPAPGIDVAISVVESAVPLDRVNVPASVTVPGGSAAVTFGGYVVSPDGWLPRLVVRATLGPLGIDATYAQPQETAR